MLRGVGVEVGVNSHLKMKYRGGGKGTRDIRCVSGPEAREKWWCPWRFLPPAFTRKALAG